MSWNYRMVWHTPARQSLAIHEVTYADDGSVRDVFEPAAVETHNHEHDDHPDRPAKPSGLAWALDKMREALAKPVLIQIDGKWIDDGPPESWPGFVAG